MYGIAFMLLTLVLYILTIQETFENLDLGQLTIGSFFRYLPQTFRYFMEAVATFWGLFIAPVAIVLALIFKGIGKLIAR